MQRATIVDATDWCKIWFKRLHSWISIVGIIDRASCRRNMGRITGASGAQLGRTMRRPMGRHLLGHFLGRFGAPFDKIPASVDREFGQGRALVYDRNTACSAKIRDKEGRAHLTPIAAACREI